MKHINQIVLVLSLFITCFSHAMVTELHRAVADGNLEQVRTLLDKGVDVNAVIINGKLAGFTPLHRAVCNKGEAIVWLLLEREANVNAAAESDGWTPLHYAAFKGYETIAHLLLKAGANPDATTKFGFTPLALAQNWHHQAVKILLFNWKRHSHEIDNEEAEKRRNILLSWRYTKENLETPRPTNESWFSQFNNPWFQRGAVATAIAGLGVLGYQLFKRR